MNKYLEYKRGFYKASHFPISEIDLYNFKYDDEETNEWKNGFQRGFEKKYNCDILNDYEYVIDPFILQARNHLKTLANLSENGISVQKYDSLKNNVYKLVDSLSKYLPKPEFIKLFNNGILKNKTLLNLENMNDLKYLKKTKEKKFENKNIMYDVMTSLREKINAPSRNRKSKFKNSFILQ